MRNRTNQVTLLLRNKENPLVGPIGPIVKPGLLTWLTLMVHNFVSIGQVLTQPVPIGSPGQDLSIGTGLVKIWSMLTKLWTIKVHHVNNHDWAVGPLIPTSGTDFNQTGTNW